MDNGKETYNTEPVGIKNMWKYRMVSCGIRIMGLERLSPSPFDPLSTCTDGRYAQDTAPEVLEYLDR